MMNVLIVENCEEDRCELGEIMDSLGLPIQHSRARTEREFFEQLILTDPDLIMAMDPSNDFSGLDALNILKRVRLEKPFIFVSEIEDEAQALKYHEAGALHYLSKSNTDKLKKVIENAAADTGVIDDLYRHIFDTHTTGLLVVDRDGYHIIDSNKSAAALLGYSRDELRGKNLMALWSSRKMDTLIDGALPVIVLGDSREELELITANDKSVHISDIGRSFEIKDHSAKVITICETKKNDVSTKALNENESQWFNHITPTLRTLVHHFQNSYTVIGGYHTLLEKSSLSDQDKLRMNLETLKEFIGRDMNVLSRLSRISTGYIHDKFGKADLNQIVRNVIGVIQASIPNNETSLRLIEQLDRSPPMLVGQEKALYDLVTCLGQNAVEACGRDAVITFQTAHTDSHVILTVSDTGRGMDRSIQETCLRPFVTTKTDRGAGLGLSIVFGIVQRHSGDLSIRTKQGVGTTVQVLIPV